MSRFESLRASASGALPQFTPLHQGPGGKGTTAGAGASASSVLFGILDAITLRDADFSTIAVTVLAIIATGLIYEQVRYRQKKAGLPGPAWTIPVIGKFADSLRPSLENYKKGWNSGPLSVASVFHM